MIPSLGFPTLRFVIIISMAAVLTVLPASAQDKLITVDGVVTEGKIIGVRGNNLEIQDAAGVKLPFPLSRVRSVEMAEPQELKESLTLLEKGEHEKSLPGLQKISDNFLGLPTDWAKQAVSAYGVALVSSGRLELAEKVFTDYGRIYGADGSLQAQVGLARIAIEKGTTAKARDILSPLAAEALGKLQTTPSQGRLFSNVFLLIGRIEEIEGNKPLAMENYQRVLTAFPEDSTAFAEAARRAASLGDVHVP